MVDLFRAVNEKPPYEGKRRAVQSWRLFDRAMVKPKPKFKLLGTACQADYDLPDKFAMMARSDAKERRQEGRAHKDNIQYEGAEHDADNKREYAHHAIYAYQ